MISSPTFKATWLPLILAGFALIVLNLGLYLRLSADPALEPSTIELPYNESFDAITNAADLPYESFGGDWEIRDASLVQISTTGNDLGTLIPLNVPAEDAYQFSTDLRYLSGMMGGGILFNAQQVTSRQQSHMVRFNVDANVLYLIFGYFDDASNFFGQGSIQLDILPNSPETHRIGVTVQNDNYVLTLDNQQVTGDVPLQYKGGSAGLITSNSQFAFDNVSANLLESGAETPTTVATATPETVATVPTEISATTISTTVIPATLDPTMAQVIYSDSFDTASGGESPWVPFSGNWVFESGALVQQQFDGYDLGIGHQSEFNNLLLRVNFQHREGQGGGVLFNMPQANSKNGGQMVRYVPDADFMVWGYFDENGAFNAQGSVPVPDPATDVHNLEVVSANGTFTAHLDGQLVAENIPLYSQSGHIGLTSSQSVVAFNSVEILSADAQAVPEVTAEATSSDSDLTFNTINGEWITEDGVTTQTDPNSTDFVAGTGVAAEKFIISTDILLPTDEAVADAGGGIVFHMGQRDNPAGGQMVRFGKGGEEIFWGQYDADGIFVGQGGAPLVLEKGVPHNLKLVVRVEDFDILVDDIAVINSVPLQQSSGWVGLISFKGPVAFSNIQLTISGT